MVDQRVRVGCGVGEVDRDLAVLDLAGHTGVLAGDPDGVAALLQIAGLAGDQDHVVGAQMVDDVAAQGGGQGVLVQACPAEQVLDPVRGGVCGLLGQGPAVLTGQQGEQGTDHLVGGGAGLGSGQVGVDDRVGEVVQQVRPTLGRWAGGCGHRLGILCSHNH